MTAFAIAFAYVEAMVVVYSRIAFYPEGFHFPLVEIPMRVYIMELGREAMTLAMLAAVGFMVKGRFWQKFGAFVYAWGLWDIFYYVWLYVFLKWPSSLGEWDILFLIPVPWIGPVWSPVSVAVLMIVFGVASWVLEDRFKPDTADILVWVVGSLVCFVSFVWLYRVAIDKTVPQNFPWYLTAVGDLLITAGIVRVVVRGVKLKQNQNDSSAVSDTES